jgi:hypothetical protein
MQAWRVFLVPKSSTIRCWDLKRSLTKESFEIILDGYIWSKWYVFGCVIWKQCVLPENGFNICCMHSLVHLTMYKLDFVTNSIGFTCCQIPPTYVDCTKRGPIQRADMSTKLTRL